MDLQQLRYFVAVVEEAGFTRAAAREHVAQPAVSASLKGLERELGVRLLDRGRHGARPTSAGQELVTHARAALAAAAHVREVAGELTGLLRGRVVVGMVVGCTARVLAAIVAEFARAHPGVVVDLTEGPSDDLLDGVRTGRLDLAWVGRAEGAPPGVETAVLHAEDQLAVTTDPALPDPLPVTRLDGRRVVVLPKGTGGRAALDAACGDTGTAPEVAFEVSGLEMVLRLAALGLGVGIVPESVAAGAPADLRMLTLDPPVCSRIEIAWRAGGPGSPAGRALVEVARRHVAAWSASGA